MLVFMHRELQKTQRFVIPANNHKGCAGLESRPLVFSRTWAGLGPSSAGTARFLEVPYRATSLRFVTPASTEQAGRQSNRIFKRSEGLDPNPAQSMWPFAGLTNQCGSVKFPSWKLH